MVNEFPALKVTVRKRAHAFWIHGVYAGTLFMSNEQYGVMRRAMSDRKNPERTGPLSSPDVNNFDDTYALPTDKEAPNA